VARNQFGAYEQVTKIAPRHRRDIRPKSSKKTKITSGHVNCINTERASDNVALKAVVASLKRRVTSSSLPVQLSGNSST
jgi:hypothetical protein